MTATLYLARHASHAELGRVLSGRSDIALNERGRAEADHLAQRLADIPLAAIHTSPRRRARETAAAIAASHGLAVQVEPELDEIDFGSWSGRAFAALDGDADWDSWNSHRATARTPAGDSMAAAVSRALACIGRVAQAGAVLCVSHCDVIRGLVAHYLGLGAGRLFAFDCDPGSLTTLTLSGDGARLVTLNERPA